MPEQNRWSHYDDLRAHRDAMATMCAMYTEAGLYDLAKERARLWKLADDAARAELNRRTDYLIDPELQEPI